MLLQFFYTSVFTSGLDGSAASSSELAAFSQHLILLDCLRLYAWVIYTAVAFNSSVRPCTPSFCGAHTLLQWSILSTLNKVVRGWYIHELLINRNKIRWEGHRLRLAYKHITQFLLQYIQQHMQTINRCTVKGTVAYVKEMQCCIPQCTNGFIFKAIFIILKQHPTENFWDNDIHL